MDKGTYTCDFVGKGPNRSTRRIFIILAKLLKIVVTKGGSDMLMLLISLRTGAFGEVWVVRGCKAIFFSSKGEVFEPFKVWA